ncbi:hypothetical protein JCM10914A_03510 [Paenibacillus sp. JCM 10914]
MIWLSVMHSLGGVVWADLVHTTAPLAEQAVNTFHSSYYTGSSPTGGQIIQASTPQSLTQFAEETVSRLSAHAPFTAWADAKLTYTPLGPGTHGWLVTITAQDIPQGYLIISASEDGGYILSEYGIGTTLPYSQASLGERLVAEGLMRAGGGLPTGSTVRMLYNVSPLWQIELPDQPPVYINALNYERLPEQQSLTLTSYKRDLSGGTGQVKGVVSSSDMTMDAWRVGQTALAPRSHSDNPYDNLMWLTTTDLPAHSSTELRGLLEQHRVLTFRSQDGNAAFGAPFNITGWHRWISKNADNRGATYVAVPLAHTDTLRFLPGSQLIGEGKFYVYPQSLSQT